MRRPTGRRQTTDPQRRVKVEIVDATTATIRYLYPCGHTRQDQLLLGPKGPNSVARRRPMAPDLLRKLVPYWNQAGGLSTDPCPTCARRSKRLQTITPVYSIT